MNSRALDRKTRFWRWVGYGIRRRGIYDNRLNNNGIGGLLGAELLDILLEYNECLAGT